MKKNMILTMALAVVLALGLMAPAFAGGQGKSGNSAKSLGKVTLDTDISAGINYGTGIDNGKWVVAEKQGIELGLRATDRTDGLLDVTGTNGNRIGVYEAATGFDTGTANRAEWNYEWSVDLSGAKGNAKGRTLDDYRLVLEQDYTEESLFEVLGSDPVMLPMPDVCHYATATVCQQSWNPTFGNDDFDPQAEGTYNLRLVLTPDTFNGPPVAVQIQVNVSDE